MMGPLYHLVAKADRKAAVKDAFTRLQTGGIIFSSFLSRYGVVGDLLKENPGWIEVQAEVRSFLEKGRASRNGRKDGLANRPNMRVCSGRGILMNARRCATTGDILMEAA